jgi:hypothetical protein
MLDPHLHTRDTTAARPSDELVLAALERAAHHQVHDSPAAPAWSILEHLSVPRRSAAARHVSARLVAMHTAGLVERSRRHGVPTWELTGVAARRLRDARRAGELPALPESPQHRTWRQARTAAEQEIDRFRDALRARLREATPMLEAASSRHGEPRPNSDAWLELGEELQRACRRLASASYCLSEWAEPDDEWPDIDRHVEPSDAGFDASERAHRRARRAGRRNVRLWNDTR